MKLRFCWVLVLGLTCLGGCGTNWVDVESTAGSYRIKFPGTPKETTVTRNSAAGLALNWTVKSVEASGTGFEARYAELPAFGAADVGLEIQNLAGQYGGQIVSKEQIKVNGFSGYEFDMSITTPRAGFAVARVVHAHNEEFHRAFVFLVLGEKISRQDQLVRDFLDSVEITIPPPKKQTPPDNTPGEEGPIVIAAPGGNNPVINNPNPVINNPPVESPLAELKLREVMKFHFFDNVLPFLVWNEAGDGFFLARGRGGKVEMFTLTDFRPKETYDSNNDCTSLSMCKEGLLVSVNRPHEILVLDPGNLSLKRKIPIKDLKRVTGVKNSSRAWLEVESFFALDYRVGWVETTTGLAVPFTPPAKQLNDLLLSPVLTPPDGTYLFTRTKSDQLIRSKTNEQGQITKDEMSNPLGNGKPGEICISPDGKYVCLPVSGGNPTGLPFHPSARQHSTYIYPVESLLKPAFVIEHGSSPATVAFDMKHKLVLGGSAKHHLQVFDFKGAKLREWEFPNAGTVTQILPHPDNGTVLVLTDRNLFVAELPKELLTPAQ